MPPCPAPTTAAGAAFFAQLHTGGGGFVTGYQRGILVAIGFVLLAVVIALVDLGLAGRSAAAPQPRELEENRC